MLWEYFENTLRMLWGMLLGCFGDALGYFGMFWRCFEDALGMLWQCFEDTVGMLWQCFEDTVGMLLGCFGGA